MTSFLTGITISKSNLILNSKQCAELQSLNIGIHECSDRYVLYYMPNPCITNAAQHNLFKGLLARVRSDQIYSAYNNDYGMHEK